MTRQFFFPVQGYFPVREAGNEGRVIAEVRARTMLFRRIQTYCTSMNTCTHAVYRSRIIYKEGAEIQTNKHMQQRAYSERLKDESPALCNQYDSSDGNQ